ncbi:hypothetical protein ACLE20_13190 [Rhizobium sp. YIM 134829]|uniref:hypothetical protein n=1 Tax=Rhizobium sp. YIM 134829 TaxID=3390453 RepID=UPI00397ABF31
MTETSGHTAPSPQADLLSDLDTVARAISSRYPSGDGSKEGEAWYWSERYDHPANEFEHESRDEDRAIAKAALAVFTPPVPQPQEMAAADVIAERRRQVEAEGWTPEHDDFHSDAEMAQAASCYAYHSRWGDNVRKLTDAGVLPSVPLDWPWAAKWWKPSDPRRDLVKAGALILAEIERLDRAALAATEGSADV